MKLLLEVTIIIFNVVSFSCQSNFPSLKGPLWTWDCENRKCIPFRATKTGKLQSLVTCNMLCSSVQLWPLPTGSVSLATTAVPVRAEFFQLEVVTAPTNIVGQYLRDAFLLFKQDLRNTEGKRRVGDGHNVIVRISVNDSGDPRMRVDTNESYQLSVIVNGTALALVAEIIAQSFCGARHALETLSQLVWLDSYVGSLLMLQAATINDAPTFRYRGLMIDTARNYFPLGEMLHTIDAMAASKLNTLHWHASDSQAFSLQLKSMPQLAQYGGAYSLAHVYTSDQIRAIAARAQLRGIRVLIEIDTPAHVGRAWSWGSALGYENLEVCIDSKTSSTYCESPPCGQLNPHHPLVFELLQRIYTEIIDLTGVDDMFHLGGDDISERCWQQYFNETDTMELWMEFTRTALQQLENASGFFPNLTLFWSSRLSEKLKTDLKHFIDKIGLQTRNVEWSEKYISGVRTIVSHEDAWDLNNGQGAWHGDNSNRAYNSWQRAYEHRPWVRSGTSNIEGGEATVWSWTVSEGGLDSRIWPRAAAVAERLWTDHPAGATRPVHVRLDMHRNRLSTRGVHSAPIWSYWCTQNPYSCT